MTTGCFQSSQEHTIMMSYWSPAISQYLCLCHTFNHWTVNGWSKRTLFWATGTMGNKHHRSHGKQVLLVPCIIITTGSQDNNYHRFHGHLSTKTKRSHNAYNYHNKEELSVLPHSRECILPGAETRHTGQDDDAQRQDTQGKMMMLRDKTHRARQWCSETRHTGQDNDAPRQDTQGKTMMLRDKTHRARQWCSETRHTGQDNDAQRQDTQGKTMMLCSHMYSWGKFYYFHSMSTTRHPECGKLHHGSWMQQEGGIESCQL